METLNKWCECEAGQSFDNCTYYKDNEHPTLKKHHWRCKKCGGVTQVG